MSKVCHLRFVEGALFHLALRATDISSVLQQKSFRGDKPLADFDAERTHM